MKKPDQGSSSELSRRDALKLASAVASLGAGLGVVLDSSDADAADPARLQFKFWRLPESGDESKAELVATLTPIPEDEAKLLEVPQGRLQLKIHQFKMSTGAAAEPTVLVKQIVPLDTAALRDKTTIVQHKSALPTAPKLPTR